MGKYYMYQWKKLLGCIAWLAVLQSLHTLINFQNFVGIPTSSHIEISFLAKFLMVSPSLVLFNLYPMISASSRSRACQRQKACQSY